MSNITLVTGIWDIGRGELTEGWSRPYQHYLDKFEKLLEVEENLIVFGDEELREFVFKKRKPENTQFIVRPLSWFTNSEFFPLIQKIRTNPDWYNKAGWLGNSTQAKLEMSPELVNEISWLFKECAKTCPTILITGNHDCNMNNMDRMDVLTPLVDALELENFYYLRDTQVFSIGGIDFSVFSILDNKDNWISADKMFGNKKIALFHGPVDNSQTDIGYVVSSRHFTTDIFDGFDLALLGDIHKRQEMISPKGCKVVYAGSLIQQNFGEKITKHGYGVYDIEKDEYDFVDLPNPKPFLAFYINSIDNLVDGTEKLTNY